MRQMNMIPHFQHVALAEESLSFPVMAGLVPAIHAETLL
jgi:hypothetical protein